MPRATFFFITACLLGYMLEPATIHAQTTVTENLQAVSEKVIEVRNSNLQALKDYSWNQRTEVMKDGEIMSTRLELVRYDGDGKEQRSILTETKPEQKKRIAGRVQKKKMGEMQEWGEGVNSFMVQYALPNAASLSDFLGKASIKPTEISGQIMLNSNNVVQPGDRMTMYVDKVDKRILNTQVFTNYGQDPVYLEITHGQLPEGIVYTREMKLEINTKGLQLTVENFNYNQN